MTNRRGELITTAVTNLDLHDLARSARTFEIENTFIVTPISDQRELVGRILGHWSTEASKAYHPDRVEAVSRVRVLESFEEVKKAVAEKTGQLPEVVFTDARPLPRSVSTSDYRVELERRSQEQNPRPVVIVFGTGWGIAESFYPEVHRILVPVYGPKGHGGYNHLSVRAAVAIILDRLFGQ